jgi:hypothetical protein
MDYQRAMMYMAKEQVRGMIAGGYVEQIKSAINNMNKIGSIGTAKKINPPY